MHCSHPITLKSGEVVPCGKCPQCLANKRQEWVFRIQQEYKQCAFGLFVTLTYDEEHLPPGGVNKRDIQLFLKRLRKNFDSQELRYYIVSEYGDHTYRAHYHGLFFFKNKHDKRKVYDLITNSWQNGNVQFGDIEEGSIVYCTKYCLKKSNVPEGHNSNFRLVSKMHGGLGANYVDDHQNYHLSSQQFDVVYDNGKCCRIPRYYRDKFYELYFGKSRQNPQFIAFKEQRKSELYDKQVKDYQDRFIKFYKSDKFSSIDEAYAIFNEKERQRIDRQSELIIKHTQKQKM